MARNVPSYLHALVVEGTSSTKHDGVIANELTLCQIQATEEQTDAIKELTNAVAKIAEHLDFEAIDPEVE